MSAQAPFTRLLLATEHSEHDTGAERVALALARRCGRPLAAVLPLASNPEFEAIAPQLAARRDAEAAEKLKDMHLAAGAAGVELVPRVRHGLELAQEIVDEAKAEGSDLIVARRRGQRGLLSRLLVGEMVTRVAAHAPCSVLLVPRAASLWTRGVMVGLDPALSEAARQPLIDTAVAVAAECALPLSVVVVRESDDETARAQAESAIRQATRAAEARQVSVHGEARSGRPFEQIVAAADARGADLIVVGRHAGGLAGRAWLGGTTQKVIGTADRPVLIAIPKEPQA